VLAFTVSARLSTWAFTTKGMFDLPLLNECFDPSLN
jgi:hypothetical protein